MGAIKLNSVEKWYGNAQVIKGVDLHITDGEFIVFVGPSGLRQVHPVAHDRRP